MYKKDKLFEDHATQVCEAHNQMIVSFLQQVSEFARPITEGSREQCTRVRRCKEEHTLIESQNWGPLNDWGLRILNWESQSKDPQVRVWKTDTFSVLYEFVLNSVTCQKTCHFITCFMTLWTSISSCLYCEDLTFLLVFGNMNHFTNTFSQTHTEVQITSTYRGTDHRPVH